MRKPALLLALALSLGCAAVAAGASAAPQPMSAKLTIRAFPEGVFGYLSSGSKACSENRKVIVFEQRGVQRDPGGDRRVGNGRAKLDQGVYRWQVETDEPGSYYAQAAARKGCAAPITGSVEATAVGQANGADFPTCSPYVGEGPTDVCSLGGIRLQVTGCLDFSSPSGSCSGSGYGTFPWGVRPDGGPGFSIFNWASYGRERAVIIISQQSSATEIPPLSRIEAHMADPGSHRLEVDRAMVQSENGIVEFFTPNLPGQAAGEVGGPLDLNFEPDYSSSNIYLNGYLYLKRQG